MLSPKPEVLHGTLDHDILRQAAALGIIGCEDHSSRSNHDHRHSCLHVHRGAPRGLCSRPARHAPRSDDRPSV